jgi:hypothetical protein
MNDSQLKQLYFSNVNISKTPAKKKSHQNQPKNKKEREQLPTYRDDF